ncbi:MAG: hypothetical protein JKX98_08980 [Alcanivoracaceae bacterium]|nr:hypothetical protein [Alcanivoracaceae bacterium]
MNIQIPIPIEEAILANRQKFQNMNDKARKDSDGEFGFITRPKKLGKYAQFWKVEDDDELEEFLFDDLLAATFDSQNIDLNLMPKGYDIILNVLEFERHCQFSGWYAICNRSDSMHNIINCYQQIGLEEEATALHTVWKAYNDLLDDNIEEFSEILSKAYREIPSSTPNIEDKIPYILKFIRNNTDLFIEQND